MCGANRAAGKIGLCGADDKIYVARAALHFWEEPPISGLIGGLQRGQGPGSGTIFFSNCNMKCVYCQNYKISGISANKLGRQISINELVNMCLDLQKQGAMNINFVTPTHYRSHIISAVRIAKSIGLQIPIVWNTSGYESLASIYALNSIVDVWLTDFKYSDNLLAKKYSQNNIDNYLEVALDALDAMFDFCNKATFDNFNENLRMTSGLIVRHLLLPGEIENSKKVLSMLFERYENNIKYSIMNQYTPVINKDSKVAKKLPNLLHVPSAEEYEELLNFADDLGIKDYYWQDGQACTDSFIPEFSK